MLRASSRTTGTEPPARSHDMRHSRHRALWAVMLALVFVAAHTPPAIRSAHALSIQEEKKIGEEFVAQIKKQFQLIEDDFSTDYLNRLGSYLAAPLETRHFPFHFYLVKNNALNAFAAPGGHIFIFTGLIDAFDRVDELASVICHEIGHVSARHLSQRLEQGKKIGIATAAGILAGALLGGEAAEALITGSLAGAMQAQLHYSRNDERQADQLGFKYMSATGFDPRSIVNALKTIERSTWGATTSIPAYLLTHPAGPERMTNLDMMIREAPPPQHSPVTSRLKTLYPYFQTVTRARSMDSQEAERFFLLALEKGSAPALADLGLGVVYFDREDHGRAVTHLERALEYAPDTVAVMNLLGDAYRMKGDPDRALEVLNRARLLDPENTSVLFLLGRAHESLGHLDLSVRLFERVAVLASGPIRVYYHLGQAYGKLNRLDRAHYNFGRYFEGLGRTEKARFHFRKAQTLSERDPALTRTIERALEALAAPEPQP